MIREMEERVIKITLDKAKEWYKSGDENLKEIALQAFKEYELNDEYWKAITSLAKACNRLGLPTCSDYFLDKDINSHTEDIRKIDVIRKALNGDWDNLTCIDCSVYFPKIKIVQSVDLKCEKDKGHSVHKIIINSTDFYLIGGMAVEFIHGMMDFHSVGNEYNPEFTGFANPMHGIFGCKSKEIAEHMSRYFAKEIFDATFKFSLYGRYKFK